MIDKLVSHKREHQFEPVFQSENRMERSGMESRTQKEIE